MNNKTKLKKLTAFAITWPIFVEMLTHILMGNVDTFMLSHVSDDAVAAVGVTRQLLDFSIILFNLLGLGVGVIIAQYVGAKNFNYASKIAASAITLNFAFGIAISILFVLNRDLLLSFYHLSPELNDLAQIYLLIVGGTLFLEAIMLTIGPVIRSHGFTMDTMYVGIGMNVVNVIGNALLIYGLFGLPELGVMGVAISTAFSRILGFIFLVFLLYKRIQVPIAWRDYIQIKWREIIMTLKIGVPSGLEWLSFHFSQMMVTKMVTTLGATALATHIYASNIVLFFMLFSMAIGEGTEILVAQLFGAKKVEKAYKQLLRSLRWAFGITVGLILIVSLFREKVLLIFTNDLEIITVGSAILLFCILLEPGRVFNHVIINSLRAAGDVKFPLVMAIISMWGLKVPLAYLFGIHLGFGVLGVWIAHACDEWVRGVIHYRRWTGRKWERKLIHHIDSIQAS
ncbi:MATE family efflux transporter [Litchfieldia salsa]|uniref:Putative efflux protein, MATE family n=1 Tax=Litchfieldia salsa TaxID=930152 RepID=A0A1H0WLX9_9BACI|nr:MATE family efflux transporter [Litchfieldia salsa]SDP91638.1 putative efflux protein, MATE family [Litchfieldia salsa]